MPHAEIALVIARRDVYALERAKAAGVATQIIQGKRAAFEAGALAALCEHKIDVIVLAGFLTILSENFIAHYAGRILNIHPALLPAFGGQGFYGLKVHEAALARGVKLTGATVHLVDATPDGGPILAQKAVAVLEGDTPETLQRRVMEQAEWLLLPQTLEQFCKEMNA
jgi:phosphoribosylglycinamide formyltransferase-1